MKQISNLYNVPESLQMWLVADTYDHSARDEKTFSATEIIRHPRQVILTRRAAANNNMPVEDYIGLVVSRLGQTVHSGVEHAWKNAIKKAQQGDYTAFETIGWRREMVDDILVNPTAEQLKDNPDCIPIYIEHRVTKPLGDYFITGELDFCIDGQLEDFKMTKTYSYSTDLNDAKYAKQGSIYKWLCGRDVITSPDTQISFIFKDFKKAMSGSPNYPPADIATKKYPLASELETQRFLTKRLALLEELKETPEPELPKCDDDTLMVAPFTYAYYGKAGAKRATKTSSDYSELEVIMKSKGTGYIETRGGEVRGCSYCSAFHECTQKDEYLENGRLTLI